MGAKVVPSRQVWRQFSPVTSRQCSAASPAVEIRLLEPQGPDGEASTGMYAFSATSFSSSPRLAAWRFSRLAWRMLLLPAVPAGLEHVSRIAPWLSPRRGIGGVDLRAGCLAAEPRARDALPRAFFNPANAPARLCWAPASCSPYSSRPRERRDGRCSRRQGSKASRLRTVLHWFAPPTATEREAKQFM